LHAGVLHWFTSPGLPAVKIFEVTSHLVWTHQTTDDPRQLLGPGSSLSVRSIPMYGPPSGPSPDCCPSTTTQCSHTGAGRCGCHHLRRLLWPVVALPWEKVYKEVFWRLSVNDMRAAGLSQLYFSAPCPFGVVGSGAQGDGEWLRQHAFWECAIAQAVRAQVQRGLGGALLQQRHLWLVFPPSFVFMTARLVTSFLSHDSQTGYIIRLQSTSSTVQLSCKHSLALNMPPLAHWVQLFPDGLPPAHMWDTLGPGADDAPLRPYHTGPAGPDQSWPSVLTSSLTLAASCHAALAISLVD
jgi:hypothetical protein